MKLIYPNKEFLHIRVTPRQQPYCFVIQKIWGEWIIAFFKQGRQEPGSHRQWRIWGKKFELYNYKHVINGGYVMKKRDPNIS